MRIRFFNTYEPVTTIYRDLLPALAGQGVQVEAYISASEYRPGRSSLVNALHHPNLNIKYLPSLGMPPTGRLQKIWIMLTYMSFAAALSLFSSPVDINCFLTQPPFFSLWGWMLKLLRNQRYYCLIMDIYPDVAVGNGILREHGLMTRLFMALARFTWEHADGIIVVGRCQKDKLLSYGVPESKIHFIPNWANNTIVHPVSRSRNNLGKELGLRDAFVVLYSGNMGNSHDFQTLLGAAERLLPHPKIQFVLIGSGFRRSEVEAAIRIQNLKNVTLLPLQPPERLAESLSLGDVHIVTLRNGFEGLVVPSKAYSAQATGRPLIYVGHPSGEIARMIRESGSGIVVPVGDSDKLARSILRYYQDPSLKRLHGQKALRLYRNQYHVRNALMNYTELFMGQKS